MKLTWSLALFLLASLAPANAQTTRTWDGEGGDGLWATTANWSGNALPITGGTAAFTTAGITTCRLNLPSTNYDGNILFGNGSTFTINGLAGTDNSSINLSSASAAYKVEVTDAGTYTIALSSSNTTNVTNSANGRLKFGSLSPTFDVAAGGTLILGGRYSSNSGNFPTLVKAGAGTLRLEPTTVTSGMNAQANVTAGTLLLNGGANNVLTGISGIAAGATVRMISAGNNLVSGTTTSALSGVRGVAGTFDLNGFNTSVPRIEGSLPTGVITNGGSADVVLTVGNYGTATGLAADLTATTFAGSITDGPTKKTGLTVTSGTTPYTLGLSGPNTYSGPTVVDAGVLSLQGGTISNTSGVTLSGTGKLRVGNGASLYQNLALPNLAQNGSSAVELDLGGAANDRLTISGAYAFTAGSLTVNVLAPPTLSGSYVLLTSGSRTGTPAVTVTGLAGSRVTPSVTTTPTEVKISFSGGAANLVWQGNDPASPNNWDLAVTNNFLNGVTADSFHSLDTVTFNDAAVSFTPTITTAIAPTAVTFNNSASDYTLNGSGLAGGSLAKSGTALLTITGNHTFAGGTTLNDGRLLVGSAAALGTGPLNLLGGWLSSASTTAYTLANPITVNGVVKIGDTTATGAFTFSGPVTLAGNTELEVPGPFTVSHTIAGSVSDGTGTFKLTKQGGSGVLALNAANTYKGGTEILGGRINANHLAAFGSGPVAVEEGGQAYLIAAGTYGNPFKVAGKGPSETAGQLGAIRLNANTLASNITLTDSARITAYATTGTLTGAIGESAPGMVLEYGGAGLAASGGTITVSGNNSYSGGTEIRGAIVRITSNTALGSGDIALRIPSAATYLTRLELGPNVVINSPLMLESNGQTGSLAAIYSDAGDATTASLAVVGGPVEILQPVGNGAHFGARAASNSILRVTGAITSPNAHPVTVRLGTVEVGGGGSYGSLQHAAGTLKLAAHQGISQEAVLTLGSSATAGENSTFDLNGFNQTLTGLIKGTQTATVLNNGAAAASLTLATAADSTYAGVFENGAGTLNLIKTGTGKLTLTGNSNTFPGTTSINAGTLNLTGTLGAFTSNTTLASGSRLAGEGTVGGNLTLGGAELEVNGNTDLAELTVNGNLTVTGAVNVKLLSLPPISGAIGIIAYSGTYGGGGGFTLTDAAKFRSPVFSTTAGVVNLNLGTPLNLTWSGIGGSTWDVGNSTNWKAGTTPAKFLYADNVTFNDSVLTDPTIEVAGEVLAGTVTFSNSTRAYTLANAGAGMLRCASLTKAGSNTATIRTGVEISGTVFIDEGTLRFESPEGITQTISGIIDGPATLAKGGAGSLSITGANPAFSGELVIAKGELIPTNNAALGTARLVFGDATTTPSDVCTLTLNTGTALATPQVEVAPTCLDARIAGIGGSIANTAITKRGLGRLTIGHPTDYTQSATYVAGTSSVVIEKGSLAFSSLTALASNLPITLGNATSGDDHTVLEVPRAASADQAVLSTALTLGTLAGGSKSEAIVRYTGTSAGSNTSNGAPSVTGTVNLNGRDLFIENTSHQTGGTTRLANFQAAISGNGNVRIRCGTNSDGSASAGPRFRIQSTANNWVGDLYVETGYLQIGFTSECVPNDSLLIMAAGTAMGMGNPAETIRGLRGGAATEAVPSTARIENNAGNSNTLRITLTDSNAANTHVYDGRIVNSGTGFMALTKAGAATQVINGPCSFTGTTLLNAGKLVINNTYASAITVAAGATLGGNMTSSDAVTATATGAKIAPGNSTGTMTAASAALSTGGVLDLEIDDSSAPKNDKLVVTGVLNVSGSTLNLAAVGTPTQPAYVLASYGTLTGTFGTVTKSAALAAYDLVYNFNDGTSTNNIALVAAQADPYLGWLASYAALSGANLVPGADFDGDGLDNGIEFVIGSDPTAFTGPSTAGYPTATVTGGNLVFTFKRGNGSKAYAVTVETSTDLASWPPSSSYLVPTADTAGPPVAVAGENVTVTIPMAPDAKKFARLKAGIPFTP